MKRFILVLMAVAVCGVAVYACTTGEQQEKPAQSAEKPAQSAIDTFTDKKATEFGDKIRNPINKARMTQRLGDQRLDAIDQALQKQSGGQQ